jgi:hypothetical protein
MDGSRPIRYATYMRIFLDRDGPSGGQPSVLAAPYALITASLAAEPPCKHRTCVARYFKCTAGVVCLGCLLLVHRYFLDEFGWKRARIHVASDAHELAVVA